MFSVQCLPPFLSNNSHVFCPTPPRFSVWDLPCFLSNTSHVFCPTPPMLSVQHLPCFSHAFCPTPPMLSVQHLPCFLSNTSHAFCPTPPMFSVQHLPHFLSNTFPLSVHTTHISCPTPPLFSITTPRSAKWQTLESTEHNYLFFIIHDLWHVGSNMWLDGQPMAPPDLHRCLVHVLFTVCEEWVSDILRRKTWG